MNILEFARRAKVSTATVSRAFHEPDKLRDGTRQRVLHLAKELGYYPSPSGRALKRGRHDVLGILWPLEVEGAEAAFAQRVLAALTRHLVARDLDLLVCPVDRRDPATWAHARRTLQRSRADAWILMYPRHHDVLAEALQESAKPVVCLMGQLAEYPSWKCVRLDQKSWIHDALNRLKVSGASHVLFLGAREAEPDHEERLKAFENLAPQVFRRHVSVLRGWPPEKAALRELLRSEPIDAIIGVDDQAALLALEVCQEARLAVPQRVKIVGIDDVPAAKYAQPALSSYRQPLDEMTDCAVELALGLRKRSRIFQAAFVPRASLA